VRGEGFGGVDKSPQGSGRILVQLSWFMMIGVTGITGNGAGCVINVFIWVYCQEALKLPHWDGFIVHIRDSIG
jgi:hypothetical protein